MKMCDFVNINFIKTELLPLDKEWLNIHREFTGNIKYQNI
jgi:hypothetical protein